MKTKRSKKMVMFRLFPKESLMKSVVFVLAVLSFPLLTVAKKPEKPEEAASHHYKDVQEWMEESEPWLVAALFPTVDKALEDEYLSREEYFEIFDKRDELKREALKPNFFKWWTAFKENFLARP